MNGSNGKNGKKRRFEKLLKNVNRQLYIDHAKNMTPEELVEFKRKREEERIVREKQKEIAEASWFKRSQDFDVNVARYRSLKEADEMKDATPSKDIPGENFKLK